MRFFHGTNINFVGKRFVAFAFSGTLTLITIVSIIMHGGFNTSIDFIGGTMVQLKFERSVVADVGKMRTIVNGLGFGGSEIKTIGLPQDNEIQIIVKKKAEGTFVGDQIKAALAKDFSGNAFEVRKEEQVGPKVGGELARNAIIAVLLSCVAMIIYLAFRFSLPFGIGTIVATGHDVIVILGAISLLNIEMSIPMVAAILTIIGYSVNDTIVIFDRIRENMHSAGTKLSIEDNINKSVNQTLSRTIITASTVLMVSLVTYVVFFNSGEVIKDFAFAMIVGSIIGTYSSIFIASPVLIYWNKKWKVKV